MTLTEAILNETDAGRVVSFEPSFPGTFGVRVFVTCRHDVRGKAEVAQSIDNSTLAAAHLAGDDVLAYAVSLCGLRLAEAHH